MTLIEHDGYELFHLRSGLIEFIASCFRKRVTLWTIPFPFLQLRVG